MTQDYDTTKVQVGVASLSLRGKLVHLELTVKNLEPEDGSTWYPNARFGKGAGDYDLSGVYLTTSDGTRLLPTLVSDDECLCTRTNALSVKPQRSTTLSVSFNAPAKVPSKVDVNVPQLPLFRDVPISK